MADEQAAPALVPTWTTKRPTEPGWYWCRAGGNTYIVWMEKGPGRMASTPYGVGPSCIGCYPVLSDAAEWSAPLNPPG
jgi:hypothetical protein